MISINSKFSSCKNPIQATIHQPLQIRTNKHRCFVFCLGHTSLTCVPGIGKKNKHLLNQFGISDLSTLYSKYRSINNIQHFKQWLENDIGFTSYQAKMTTCGIRSKLGEIKEINTGLTPICCPSKEKRNRSNKSKNKQKIKRIKSHNSPDQTAVKSSDIHTAPRTTDSSNVLHLIKSESYPDQQKKNEIQIKESSINHDPSTQQFNSTLSQTNTNKDNFDNNHSESYKPIGKELHRSSSSTKDIDNIKTEDSIDGKKELPSMNIDNSSTSNSPIANRISIEMFNDQRKTYPSSNEDEILSASKTSTNPSIRNEFPRKSILRSTQSKSISPFNTDVLLSAIKQQQQAQDEPFKILISPDIDRIKTAVNYGIDSGLISESNEVSPNKIDNRSISAIKRSYASLPLSTPAVFPTKPKSTMIADHSKLSSENNLTLKTDQQTPIDSEVNKIHVTSPASISSLTKEENHKQDEERTSGPIDDISTSKNPSLQFSDKPTTTGLNPSNPISEDQSQEYSFNRSDSSANKSLQTKAQEEIRKTVNHILRQAVHTVQEGIASQIDAMSSTKINSTEPSAIVTPTFEVNDTVQSITLSSKHDDEHRTTPSKCTPLAERFAQMKEKKLASKMESNKKDVQSIQSLIQKNSSTSDQLKQSFTNTSPPHLINQFKNDKTNNENLKSTQVHSNISSVDHPISPSNTGGHTSTSQSNLTNPVIQNTTSISSSISQSPQISSSPLNVQLDTSLGPYRTSENKPPVLKEVSLEQDSNTENKSDQQVNDDHLQQKPATLTSNAETPANTSPNLDSSTLPTPYENSSLTKLVSTKIQQRTSPTPPSSSHSEQSINRINSLIDKTQSDTSNTNHFEKETEIKPINDITISSDSPTKHKNSPLNDNLTTELSIYKNPHSSQKIIPFPPEHNKQFSLTNTILFNYKKKDKHNIPLIQSNDLSSSQSIKENQFINKNLSKTNSEHQSIQTPSSPIPCNALWDNLSNDKISSEQTNQKKVNQNDYNENYHSSTTFFTFITRQQYIKERHTLNEHILYIKRTKTLNNNLNL